MVGVGITPPKVLGTPKPASSVMISRTLGAPFGGTTRGGHQAFDFRASSLMTPPNSGSGGGSCLPLMDVVALGEPNVPLTCCAEAVPATVSPAASATAAAMFALPSTFALLARTAIAEARARSKGCMILVITFPLAVSFPTGRFR